MSVRRFVIVTGLSGAGKSQVLKSLEDLGFYSLDNLPPTLLPQVVGLAEQAGYDRLAIAPDVRTAGAFGDILDNLDAVRGDGNGAQPEVLFLDASDETLLRRFSETRRKHPLGTSRLTDAIVAERSALASLRDRADRVWDTSSLTPAVLKERIAQTFANRADERLFSVTLIAFGFKYGLPLDADMVLDVRFLPNPYYVDGLRDLSGTDAGVAEYFEAIPATGEFVSSVKALLDFLIPRFASEGKPNLTLAVGCTGGRHRSVYVVRKLRGLLAGAPHIEIGIVDRDVKR